MNPALWSIFIIFLVLFIIKDDKKLTVTKNIRLKKRKADGRLSDMSEMLKNYIGKKCYIYTMNSTLVGVIKQVNDGWILSDNGKSVDAVNIDYITNIHQIPDKKQK